MNGSEELDVKEGGKLGASMPAPVKCLVCGGLLVGKEADRGYHDSHEATMAERRLTILHLMGRL